LESEAIKEGQKFNEYKAKLLIGGRNDLEKTQISSFQNNNPAPTAIFVPKRNYPKKDFLRINRERCETLGIYFTPD